MKTTVVNYHSSDGVRSAICMEGRKMLALVYIDGQVVCRRVPKTEGRCIKPLTRKGDDYPLKRAVAQFRKAGRANGITKGAAKALRGVA